MSYETNAVREDKARKKAERQMRRRRENWVLAVFAIGIAGLVVTAIGALDVSRAFISWNWPTIQATVAKTELRWYPGARSSRRGGHYNVDVTYAYRADETHCVYTDRYPKRALLVDLGMIFGYYYTREGAQAIANLYPSGAQVTVAYNPGLPRDSRLVSPLEAGYQRSAAIELAIGVIMLLGGFGAARYLKRLGFAQGTRLEKPLDETGIEI